MDPASTFWRRFTWGVTRHDGCCCTCCRFTLRLSCRYEQKPPCLGELLHKDTGVIPVFRISVQADANSVLGVPCPVANLPRIVPEPCYGAMSNCEDDIPFVFLLEDALVQSLGSA